VFPFVLFITKDAKPERPLLLMFAPQSDFVSAFIFGFGLLKSVIFSKASALIDWVY
jgi:hypothetical protein